MNSEIDIRGILPAIRVPTLVMHRTADRAVSVEGSRALARHIPNARLIELPGEDRLSRPSTLQNIARRRAQIHLANWIRKHEGHRAEHGTAGARCLASGGSARYVAGGGGGGRGFRGGGGLGRELLHALTPFKLGSPIKWKGRVGDAPRAVYCFLRSSCLTSAARRGDGRCARMTDPRILPRLRLDISGVK